MFSMEMVYNSDKPTNWYLQAAVIYDVNSVILGGLSYTNQCHQPIHRMKIFLSKLLPPFQGVFVI